MATLTQRTNLNDQVYETLRDRILSRRPGPGGKPVFNFRSEGRQFGSGRCLIVAEGFYEYTTPQDPKQKKKDRWLFTAPGDALIGIAGALLGGFLAGAIFDADPLDEFFDISTWLTAIVGAIILLAIYRVVVGDRGSRRHGVTS